MTILTPKEQAQELVNRFAPYADTFHNGNFENAKQCALIAVDEIIKILVDLSNGEFTYVNEVIYWQEVKKEITNL